MRVRRLVAADLRGLGWLDEGTRTGVAAAAEAGAGRSLVLTASDDGALLGVLAVDLPPWRDRTVPWLWLVEVHPEHRGRRIGRPCSRRPAGVWP